MTAPKRKINTQTHGRRLAGRYSTGRFSLAIASLGVAAFIATVSMSARRISAQEEAAVKIEEARAALEKWVETERTISREKRDMKISKEMLVERIELLEQEIDLQRQRITDAEENLAEATEKETEMKTERDRLGKASGSLEDRLAFLEKNTLRLLARLPEPIKERIKPLSQKVPRKPEDEEKLTLSERFQNVVGILNEADRFNSDITVLSEIRKLPDGSSAEVSTLYIGIGQAFYVNADETVAGVGRGTEDGWVWEPRNEAAVEIARAIAIMKNEQMASFVKLPVEIR